MVFSMNLCLFFDRKMKLCCYTPDLKRVKGSTFEMGLEGP